MRRPDERDEVHGHLQTNGKPYGDGRRQALSASERERVDALWRLTAPPRAEFDATYGDMLARFWRCVAAPQGEVWTELKHEALTCAVAALRVRQARVLPRFGAAEDAARLAEVMSFALAAAVLAERLGLVLGRADAPDWCPLAEDVPASAVLEDVAVPRAYGALLLPRLVEDAGLRWLGQEPVTMRALAGLFQRGSERAARDRGEGRRPDRSVDCRRFNRGGSVDRGVVARTGRFQGIGDTTGKVFAERGGRRHRAEAKRRN